MDMTPLETDVLLGRLCTKALKYRKDAKGNEYTYTKEGYSITAYWIEDMFRIEIKKTKTII
jgi:hypothetical protein